MSNHDTLRIALNTLRTFLLFRWLDGGEDRFSVGYARVSGSDQKADLTRQKAFLSPHCDEVIGDVGSGLNCNKPGLKKLLSLILDRKIKVLHLAYKDRLLRFEQPLIFQSANGRALTLLPIKTMRKPLLSRHFATT